LFFEEILMKKLLVLLLLTLTSVFVSAAEPFCSWEHPGANKYRGLPVNALKDYYMDYQVRAALQVKMNQHLYDDVVEIRRDGVVGYKNLRDMHYGKDGYCPGAVDTSRWDALHVERGLVYCVADTCVIVPTVCNNVSLIDKESSSVVGLGEEPIDISPSAGFHPTIALENPLPEAIPVIGGTIGLDETTWSGGVGYPENGSGSPGNGGSSGGGNCACRPPIVVPPCPPISVVPEPAEWVMMVLGLVCLVWAWPRGKR
jgi:hypothetical protein